MSELLNEYYKQYPNLPLEICLYFSEKEVKNSTLIHRRIYGLCQYYKQKYQTIGLPQPNAVAKICDILCENRKLSLIQRAGPDNIDSSYYCAIEEKWFKDATLKHILGKGLDYLIYGFKYIYEDYKKYVLPVEYTDTSDNISLGTCFSYFGGIATARHCIEGAKRISIQGLDGQKLKRAKFEVHSNDSMDLLFIRFETPLPDSIIFYRDAEILDEVMTLGYPRIPGYHNFLTAEKAKVSARFTTSLGSIVSNAQDIWIKEKLFLITARIRGGNSGGPVIGHDGSVVGVSVNLSKGDGDYDDLGYGTVIPVSFLNEVVQSTDTVLLDTKKTEFVDFSGE